MNTKEMLAQARKAAAEQDRSYPTWKAQIVDQAIRISVTVWPPGGANDGPFFVSFDVPSEDICFDKDYRTTVGVKSAIGWRLNPAQIATLDWTRLPKGVHA